MQEVIKQYPQCQTIIERTGVTAPFDISHASDELRDSYEIETCLDGIDVQMSDLIKTLDVDNINQEETQNFIQAYQPDIIIDFGTRRVKSHIIQSCPCPIVNLHGGDPEYYRGLDTHMWAMYHGEFDQLKTTLHILNAELDDGDIIEIRPVPIHKGMKIHEFRRYNTQTCIELVLNMLKEFKAKTTLTTRIQSQKGRYYSFMPSVLKTIAADKFETYTSQINA